MGLPVTYIWGGTGSTTQTDDYNTGTNWSSGTAPVQGQSAEFSNTGDISVTVSIGPIAPFAWTFDANAQSYTIDGQEVDFGGTGITSNAAGGTISIVDVIGGTAGVTQNGAGTLRLEGSNTYSGGTTLTAGTLDLAGTTYLTGSEGDEDAPAFGRRDAAAPSGQIQSAAAGTGTVTFEAPQGATLAIEQGALVESLNNDDVTFYNPIAGFAAAQNGRGGDIMDLRGLMDGIATFDDSTGQLSVSGTAAGTGAETEVLTLQGNYAGETFVATPDASGTGTDITLAQVAGPTIRLADDTGVSNTDRVTDDDALTGTAAPNATVTFAENGRTIGTTMADANGNYNFAPTNLPQGSQTVTASETVGEMTETASLAFTYDTTRPTITAVADSGPGIDAQGNGDLDAGKTVTLTVTTSEPVYVQGGTPALTLNDGGTATYAGGSGTNQITFSYTVASGQNTGQLAVSGVNPDGATVTDQAGNVIDPSSLSSATTPSGTLVIDTTPPTASSVITTAPQGAGPTPIGIAAPTDNQTATGNLAIMAGTLPGDGTVTLADGTTPVTAGESLTAQQLTGLEFTPRGAAGQSSAFTYAVTDGAGNAAQGTATLNVGAPGTSPTTTPTPTADAVSISQEVGYYGGVFLLSGTATSPAGVSSVEISAVVNYGQREDLGAATVNANGTFTFQDDIGAGDVQGFLQATETDGNRVQTVSADPLLSLEGPQAPDGQGPNATRYTAAGDQTAVTTFTDDGSQNVQVQGDGQTFASAYGDTFANNASLDTTFVFDPGYSLDTISGFQIGGAGHDTLSFLGSDFGRTPAAQLGRLLANASNDAGGLQIVDPTSKDVLQINGINKTQLVMNERDILFR